MPPAAVIFEKTGAASTRSSLQPRERTSSLIVSSISSTLRSSNPAFTKRPSILHVRMKCGRAPTIFWRLCIARVGT